MKFEIIYSRKIRDAVAVFTIFMFIKRHEYGMKKISELIKGKFLKKILYNLSIFYLCYGY